MAVSWSTILKALPALAAGLMPGVGAGRAAMGRLAERTLPNNLKGQAFDYPDKLTQDFTYPVVRFDSKTSVDGKEAQLPALNQGLDRNNIGAALVQNIEEHNQAIKGGYEKTLEGWWPGEDVKPRKVIHPSSSAIEGIIIDKDGRIQIKWFKGKGWYTYRKGKNIQETSRMVQELLASPSIGRALVRKGTMAHADSKDLTGEPVKDKNVGWWGRKYFDPTINMIRK